MYFMVVTLDVSKSSGWLKAVFCRVARWAYKARVSCWPGGERAVGRGRRRKPRCREGLSAGGRGEGTHIKHVVHGCDFGRVEAQRLVEGLRALPRVARGFFDAGGRCGPGGERAVGGGDGESRIAGKGFRLEVVGARARTANM